MKFLHHKETISVKLDNITIQELVFYPKKKVASSQEYYLAKVIDPNSLEIQVKWASWENSGTFLVKYDSSKEEISIEGRPEQSLLIFISLSLLPVLLFIFIANDKEAFFVLLGFWALFSFGSLITYRFSIPANNKEIKRDLINSINFANNSLLKH